MARSANLLEVKITVWSLQDWLTNIYIQRVGFTASESKCSFHGPPPSDVGPDSSRGRCKPVWTPKIRGPPFSDWEIWGPGTPRVSHGTKFFGPKFFSYYVLKMCISDIFPFFSQNSRFHAKNSPICTTLAITKSDVKIGMFLAWNLEFWLKNGKIWLIHIFKI